MLYCIYKFLIIPIAWVNKFIKRKKKNSDDLLLVFFNGNMGDFVVCAGAIERLVKSNPDRKVSILCSEKNRAIVEELNLFEKIYDINATSIRKFTSVIFRIKARDAVLIPPNWRIGFIAEAAIALIAAEHKIAARNDIVCKYNSHTEALFDEKYDKRIEVVNAGNFMEKTDELFNKITGKVTEPFLFSVKDHLELRADAKKYFAVNLGASMLQKCWPVERFARVIEVINAKTGLVPYFTGGKMEAELVEKFIEYYSGPYENYCCKTSIHELVNLIGNAAFYFGNDTGTTHIAAATEIPNFSITSFAYPPICLPYPSDYTGNKEAFPMVIFTLKDKTSCRYCRGEWEANVPESCRKCIDEKGCLECLDEITVEQVIDVLERSGIFEKYKR